MGLPWISRKFSASTAGALSIALPDPLNERPSISSEMGIFNTLPVNSAVHERLSMPDVPSKTCTTALLPLISSTWPWRDSPLDNCKFTISPYLANLQFSNTTSGPFTAEMVR